MSNLINIESRNDARGFLVVHQMLSASGFDIKLGLRDCGDIKIYEGVADGIGRTYLSKIRVEVKGVVLIDENFEKTPYSKEYVVRFVGEKMFVYFMEAFRREGYFFDSQEIRHRISEILNKAYFEKSDKAILEVVRSWGIDTPKLGEKKLQIC
ncbi:MAG: hypothetical protein OHK0038_28370 [Flammeovirgaceae bacterium]